MHWQVNLSSGKTTPAPPQPQRFLEGSGNYFDNFLRKREGFHFRSKVVLPAEIKWMPSKYHKQGHNLEILSITATLLGFAVGCAWLTCFIGESTVLRRTAQNWKGISLHLQRKEPVVGKD